MRCERWCVRCKCFVFAVGERAQPHAPLLMSRRRATDKGGTALAYLWCILLPAKLSRLCGHCMRDRCSDFQQHQTDGVFVLIRVRCVSCAMHFGLGACRVRCDLFTRCVECDSMQRVHLRFSDVGTRREEKGKYEKNQKGEGEDRGINNKKRKEKKKGI